MDDYLTKPLKAPELAAALERARKMRAVTNGSRSPVGGR
jgi:CheY-like chemotaxis protein